MLYFSTHSKTHTHTHIFSCQVFWWAKNEYLLGIYILRKTLFTRETNTGQPTSRCQLVRNTVFYSPMPGAREIGYDCLHIVTYSHLKWCSLLRQDYHLPQGSWWLWHRMPWRAKLLWRTSWRFSSTSYNT